MVSFPGARALVVLSLVAASLNALLLFVVIPRASGQMASLYSQNAYADGYDQLASNIADGHGYRFYPDTALTMMREPGYPLLLAGMFVVFGENFTAVKVMNMLMALATAWLIARTARRISEHPVVIVCAPLLFLFHPATLIAESRGGVEIPFALVLTLFFLTLYRAIEGRRIVDYVVSGAMLGMTVLVRSVPILFPLFWLAYLVIADRSRGSAIVAGRNIAVMILTMFAVMSPWIVRNYRLTGTFVPTASVLGVSAYTGQFICQQLEGRNVWIDVGLDRAAARERARMANELGLAFRDGYYQSFYASADELTFSNYLMQKVVGEYRKSPALLAKCVRTNVFNLWFAGKTWKSTMLNLAVQLPFLILAAVGTAIAIREGRSELIAPLVVFILYYTAVHVPILAQARYSVPLVPMLSILGCLAVAKAGRRRDVELGQALSRVP